jgi:hypothetical protein
MGNLKSVADLHVGDIVIYDGAQRMRVAGFPTLTIVILTALMLVPGMPSTVKTSVNDKKIAKVTQNSSVRQE